LEKHGIGNDELYYRWLGAIGLGPSHRDLSALLDRLEKEGFIATEQTNGYRVIRVTQSGIEIAQARVGVDWIARLEAR
jgi:DNA-binding PadR family transcriptional regulator